jgi:hypothetical protein
MTQREIVHTKPLPNCKTGHPGRHIFDGRHPRAGGGHSIECRCGSTQKHVEFDQALQEWKWIHRIRPPHQQTTVNANILQLGLRLRGDAAP